MVSKRYDTDEQLVDLLATDDHSAFNELFDRYWQKMLIKARITLGSEAEAEEVVQTVFLNLWRRRKSIRLKNTFHTYLSASVKYEIIDALAKSARRREIDQTAQASGKQFDNNISAWMDYESSRQLIEETVSNLPDKCQLVFRLSREAGLSESEISEQLGISLKTVGAHKTKALKALRNALQQFLFNLLF